LADLTRKGEKKRAGVRQTKRRTPQETGQGAKGNSVMYFAGLSSPDEGERKKSRESPDNLPAAHEPKAGKLSKEGLR